MKKHKVPAHVATLADRYYCEQCVRMGLKPPDTAHKPLKLGKTMREIAIDPAKLAKDTQDGLAIEKKLALEDLYLRSKL